MPSEFEVSIIIPTLRTDDDIVTCLESIAGLDNSPANEVVVVLNDPAASKINLQNHHPHARYVVNDSNLGFASAINIGARESVGEILVLLNDDMVVQPGWLSGLVKPISDGECSSTGGRILSVDGKKIDFDGSSVNLLGWGFQKGHADPVVKEHDEFSTKSRIPFACGGNLAIKTDTFEKSGGLDDDYFAYYEDVDLGWRLSLMGETINFCRDAVVFHNAGSTGSMMSSGTKWFLQERNALQNVIKNYSDELYEKILPIALGLVSVRAQVLSDLDSTDVFPDKFWHDSILGKDFTINEKDSGGLLKGLVDGVKGTLKTTMKNSRKGTLPDDYLPIENRGAGALFALEWCLNNWENLMVKRAKVQSMRVKDDQWVLNCFDDPMRPVTGHPREAAAMKPLEMILNDLMM